MNPTKGIFENLFLKIAISREKIEVARFKQCVSVGRQNKAEFPKKDLLVH